MALVIQLIAGAVGGNIAGALLKKFDLGTLWNSVAGIVGGGLGGQVLGVLGVGVVTGGTGLASIVGSIAGGGVGGGLLLVVVGIIRNALKK